MRTVETDNQTRVRLIRQEIKTLEELEIKTEFEAIFRMMYHTCLMFRLRELGDESAHHEKGEVEVEWEEPAPGEWQAKVVKNTPSGHHH
jgi:hypothetical protein